MLPSSKRKSSSTSALSSFTFSIEVVEDLSLAFSIEVVDEEAEEVSAKYRVEEVLVVEVAVDVR